MEKELQNIILDKFTLEIGNKIFDMVMEYLYMQISRDIKDIGNKANNLVKVLYFYKMVIKFNHNGNRVIFQKNQFVLSIMVINIQVNGLENFKNNIKTKAKKNIKQLLNKVEDN